MFQVELRVNGCLIDYVTIENTGACLPDDHEAVIYQVDRAGRPRGHDTVVHKRLDGALKLAALALAALTEKGKNNGTGG